MTEATAARRSIALKVTRFHPLARLPKRWSKDAVGYDLHALLFTEQGLANKKLIPPHNTVNIPTGIGIECPPGYFLLVLPRSGLAKHALTVRNSPGLIDTDYRGEVRVMLHNGGFQNFWIEHDMRIAQLVVMPTTTSHFIEVKELSQTERGESGFGSTGTGV